MHFKDRLNFIIKDRKKTPWGKSLGFTSPSITAMFNGHIPGPEFLNTIRRSENVNLNWLLTGMGSPFIVNHTLSATDLYNQLVCFLADEKWEMYVSLLNQHAVFVLTQPGQYNFKGNWIDYQLLEVLVGPGSEELARYLRSRKERILIMDLKSADIAAIAEGNVGTYGMLNIECALLTNHHTAKESDLQFFPTQVRDPINSALMRAVIRIIENCADELGESLTADQKSRIITAVYRQAERLDLNSSDLTYENVRTAIDVARD